ncbi:MAG: N-acetylmuramic acid 6-phosphate etherase [Rhodobacteraceae bacterium]|nr:MAG: N-acetylmuramic acid 6-phosphate etherase [Paracoccaceae bacterium]
MSGSQISLLQTERPHAQAKGLDLLSGTEILTILHEGQIAAIKSMSAAIPALEKGAEAMAAAIRSGGNLVYAAAGSSGLMGLADGLEIPPTFGISTSRISILRAGGLEDMAKPKGEAEDDAEAATRDAASIGPNDCVICLAASGNTVYPVTIMNIAKARGATTIGISNNDDTLLITGSDIPVFLPTPPEVIAGSTRLGAGSAQKIALNMMSTLMGVKLGHVMDGLMVNVIANNVKLLERAENIVMEITGCDRNTASENLKAANGGVKQAILITSGAKDLSDATKYLDMADQNLRTAVANITTD